MFKTFIVNYKEIPEDVNLDAFKTGGAEEYYEEYLVIQVNGDTIYCRPKSYLSGEIRKIVDLIKIAHHLGLINGATCKEEVVTEIIRNKKKALIASVIENEKI